MITSLCVPNSGKHHTVNFNNAFPSLSDYETLMARSSYILLGVMNGTRKVVVLYQHIKFVNTQQRWL